MQFGGLVKNKEDRERGILNGLRDHPAWRVSANRLHLFGIPIDRVNQAEAATIADAWMRTRSAPRSILTPDTTSLMRARWDNSLRNAYQSADLVTADGTGIIWASRLFGSPLKERVTGIDLMHQICEIAARRRKRVFLLGAKPGIANEAGELLTKRYPGLTICGTHHGYFESNDEESLIGKIEEAAPDILFVALGVPLQEKWIMKYRDSLGVPVIMGVGGSFDVVSGHLKRAPVSWQESGFEWLWRVIQEPWRWKRLGAIPSFLIQLIFYRALGWIFSSAL